MLYSFGKILEKILFIIFGFLVLTGLKDPPLITHGVEVSVLTGLRVNQEFVPRSESYDHYGLITFV